MSKKLLVDLKEEHVLAIEAIIANGLAKSQTAAIQFALLDTAASLDAENDFSGEITG